MNGDTVSGFLQLISAAVTPVVMISACAALILGVNNKHSMLSTQIRSAAVEYRQADTPETRRTQLLAQIIIFHRRFLLTWMALCSLFGAVAVFVLTTLIILMTQQRLLTFGNGGLALFGIGIVLMLIASCLEIAEVAFANRSLHIEMQDIPHNLPVRSPQAPRHKSDS